MARAAFSAELASWVVTSSGTTKKEIKERIVRAAQQTWPHVLAYVRRELADSGETEKATLALEVWEDTLKSVLQAMQRKAGEGEIGDPESYLYAAFVRLFIRAASSERRFHERFELFPSLEDLATLSGTEDHDWVKRLEEELLIKEVLNLADQFTVKVFYRRSSGDSWDEIARDFGMTAHQLKMRFRYRIEKLRRQVLGGGNEQSILEQTP